MTTRQPAVDVVRELWERFRRRDLDGGLEFFHPGVQVDSQTLPGGSRAHGHGGVWEHLMVVEGGRAARWRAAPVGPDRPR